MLSSYLIKSGNKVINSDEDANIEITQCELHVSETGGRVNVAADDIDVALLLLNHCESGMANIKFSSEKSKATFDISSSLSEIPTNIKPYLPVPHARTSCDTISAVHSKGNTTLKKRLETSHHLRSLMDVLSDRNVDQ